MEFIKVKDNEHLIKNTKSNFIVNTNKSEYDEYIARRKLKQSENQKVENIDVKLAPYFKFGCGWFVLYSKDVLNLVGVPEFLGHYGPEDTFMMAASEIAKRKGYEINQYILDGIFVSENKIYRKNSYEDKLKYIDLKDEFRNGAWSKFNDGVKDFEKTLN